LQSQYQHGQRLCEHCHQPVEQTAIQGKLIFVFGIFTLHFGEISCQITQPTFEVRHLPERVVAFVNPGFNAPQHTLDVSAIYLDIETCPPKKLERCLAYLVSYPPVGGLAAIQIWYQGDFGQLETNLQNALQNNFEHIDPFLQEQVEG
jgi:hypothetical protein